MSSLTTHGRACRSMALAGLFSLLARVGAAAPAPVAGGTSVADTLVDYSRTLVVRGPQPGVSFNAPQGIAINKLAPNMHGCYWDRETVLTVKVINGMDLVSAAEDDMLVQPLNATAIGNGPIYDSGGNIVGRTAWEVVQYANVLDKGNGVFEVSNFLRGLRGTERAINGHVNGESFVRLTDSLSRVLTTQAELNVPDTYRTMSTNTDSSGAQNIPAFADTGNSLKPYTVKVHSTLRDVDGDVTVSWWPRVRQNGQWLSGSEVAIAANDTPETYQVDVCTAAHPKTAVVTYTLTGQTLTRTLVSNGVTTSMPAPATPVGLGASFVYTAAMQAADLMSASQAQKETVFNNLAIAFDALFKGSVISAAVTTPPASPAVGDAYIVPAGATGWPVGHDDNVAFYFNGWQYIAPPLKLRLYDVATGRFMTYQGPSTHWTNDPLSTVSVLGDLTNVTGSPADGQVLTFIAVDGHWAPRTPAFTGPLAGLSDVQVSEGAPSDGMALTWNNTDHKWEPSAFVKTIPPVTCPPLVVNPPCICL